MTKNHGINPNKAIIEAQNSFNSSEIKINEIISSIENKLKIINEKQNNLNEFNNSNYINNKNYEDLEKIIQIAYNRILSLQDLEKNLTEDSQALLDKICEAQFNTTEIINQNI